MSEKSSSESLGVSPLSHISRPLWFSMCESVMGRRRKATEDLSPTARASLAARSASVLQGRPHLHVGVSQSMAGLE